MSSNARPLYCPPEVQLQAPSLTPAERGRRGGKVTAGRAALFGEGFETELEDWEKALAGALPAPEPGLYLLDEDKDVQPAE